MSAAQRQQLPHDNAHQAIDPVYHRRIIVLTAIVCRLLTCFLIILSSQLPLFDASPLVYSSSLLRWDVFHFAHMAENGKASWEHEYAFSIGLPGLMNSIGSTTALLLRREIEMHVLLYGGAVCAALAGMAATLSLYDLTGTLTGSPTFALLTSILYCFPSSPPALAYAPYTEPFFAYFSFEGMVACTRRQYLYAALFFMLATLFRANGVILGGYLGWYMVVEPFLRTKRVSMTECRGCLMLLHVVAFPFLVSQYLAYGEYCYGTSPRPWCSNTLPLVYSFVQGHYWNVGFMKYWTLSQLPNFLIASPVYMLNLYASVTSLLLPHLSPHPVLSTERLRPFALHTLGLTLLLLFNSHVQIALRLTSSLPFSYWSAAALLLNDSGKGARGGGWGRAWVAWSIAWGGVACVLWAVFLPPA